MSCKVPNFIQIFNKILISCLFPTVSSILTSSINHKTLFFFHLLLHWQSIPHNSRFTIYNLKMLTINVFELCMSNSKVSSLRVKNIFFLPSYFLLHTVVYWICSRHLTYDNLQAKKLGKIKQYYLLKNEGDPYILIIKNYLHLCS